MIVRALLTALALLAATAASAPALAQAEDAPSASPAAMAASREVARLILIESGMVSLALDQAFAEQMPGARKEIMEGPLFWTLSPQDQQAVLAYLDTLPQITREIIDDALPDILEAVAARTAAVFSEEEIVGISIFLHSPHGRSVIMRLIQNAIAGAASPADIDLTSAEQTALLKFASTRPGAAFISRADRWGRAITAGFADAPGRLAPALQARIQRDLCAILRDRCPPSLRPPSPT
jgi:hypothetical protein